MYSVWLPVQNLLFLSDNPGKFNKDRSHLRSSCIPLQHISEWRRWLHNCHHSRSRISTTTAPTTIIITATIKMTNPINTSTIIRTINTSFPRTVITTNLWTLPHLVVETKRKFPFIGQVYKSNFRLSWEKYSMCLKVVFNKFKVRLPFQEKSERLGLYKKSWIYCIPARTNTTTMA